jgi:predicted glutamine amidotransferase|tara:strand:- start:1408 stop:2271 length:864 start_codon:yes stop_codon:yes gene_type:complete
MSILIGAPYLNNQQLDAQVNHLKDMAQGRPDFTHANLGGGPKWDQSQKLIHGDGSGIYIKGDTEIHERFSNAIYNISKENILEQLPNQPTVSLMHARFATSGNKDEISTHPFNLDHIVGVHNGFVKGIEKNNKSDSAVIMDVLNNHFTRYSSDNMDALEQTIIRDIVAQSENYSTMNLILHIKGENKTVIICSYNKSKVESKERLEYNTMVIKKDGNVVYVASEDDEGSVLEDAKETIETKNHTVYVIDEETGEITEHKLDELEEIVEGESEEDSQESTDEAVAEAA